MKVRGESYEAPRSVLKQGLAKVMPYIVAMYSRLAVSACGDRITNRFRMFVDSRACPRRSLENRAHNHIDLIQ